MMLRCWLLILNFYVIYFSYFTVAKVDSFDDITRKLSYKINPECNVPECDNEDTNKTSLNLVHIQADGSEDSLHFLWSTWKLPSIIIAKTSLNTTLHINWKKLLTFGTDAISFSETPKYSFGLIITRLWEFIDEKDDGYMKNNDQIEALDLTSLNWNNINNTFKASEDFITAFPKAQNNESTFSARKSFGVQFSLTGRHVRSQQYPQLQFTSNSTQLQIVLDNLTPNNSKSRYTLELMTVTSLENQIEEWQSHDTYSLDDEYSPGVFKIVHLPTPCLNVSTECEGFLFWKPVTYIGKEPTVANSSDAVISKLTSSTEIPNYSIAETYFSKELNLQNARWNMTFGTSGDGFYKKTKYSSWSLMMGLGSPPPEKMSTTAIIVISTGLGVPLVIMLGGATFLGWRRCRRKDDDLLLSRDSMT